MLQQATLTRYLGIFCLFAVFVGLFMMMKLSVIITSVPVMQNSVMVSQLAFVGGHRESSKKHAFFSPNLEYRLSKTRVV